MRKVVLTPNDFELFDTEISSVEFEFFQKHRDAFRRMWTEQGRPFWISFIMTFRKFAVEYGVIKEFPTQNEQFQDFIDKAFILLHENFVDVKANQARSFLMDIVIVAQNKHTIQYLESKSYAKDPFYAKETREVFRLLFGVPTEKASYLKVYVLLPLYMKFGGAVCVCLRRWLEADEVPEGATFEPIRRNYDPLIGNTAMKLQKDAVRAYKAELDDPCFEHPKHVLGWPHGRNPRIYDSKNPLYVGPKWDCSKPWLYEVSGNDYCTFFAYSLTHYNAGLAKVAEVSDKIKTEKALDNLDELGTMMDLPPEVLDHLKDNARKNLRDSMSNGGEAQQAYMKELKEGFSTFPMFVPDWPLCKDPRVYDEKNPLYRTALRDDRSLTDWRSDVTQEQYEVFYNYVNLEYGKKKRKEMGSSKRRSARPVDQVTLQQEAFNAFRKEKHNPLPTTGPMYVPHWPPGRDPRFHGPNNPLYNPGTSRHTEWREEVGEQMYETFYRYCHNNAEEQGAGERKSPAAEKAKNPGAENTKSPVAESGKSAAVVESAEGAGGSPSSGGGKKKKKKNKKKKSGENSADLKAPQHVIIDEKDWNPPSQGELMESLSSALLSYKTASKSAPAKSSCTPTASSTSKPQDSKQAQQKQQSPRPASAQTTTPLTKQMPKQQTGITPTIHPTTKQQENQAQQNQKQSQQKHTIQSHNKQSQQKQSYHVEIKQTQLKQSFQSHIKQADQNERHSAQKCHQHHNHSGSSAATRQSPSTRLTLLEPERSLRHLADSDEDEYAHIKHVHKHLRMRVQPCRATRELRRARKYRVFRNMTDSDEEREQCVGIRDQHFFDTPLSEAVRADYRDYCHDVDPISEVAYEAHVLHVDGEPYTCLMHAHMPVGSRVHHKYYKLQVLHTIREQPRHWWVFESEGRIDTEAGFKRLWPKSIDQARAVNEFKEKYAKRTGNAWENRKSFSKMSKLWCPVDLDDATDDSYSLLADIDTSVPKLSIPKQRSNPPPPPRLIESKQSNEGSRVVLTSKHTDENGKVHIHVEERLISKPREAVLNPRPSCPDLAMEDDLLDDPDPVEVRARRRRRRDEEDLDDLPDYHPYKEHLEDLELMKQFTEDVRNMSLDMDRQMREGCERKIVKKKKMKDLDKKAIQERMYRDELEIESIGRLNERKMAQYQRDIQDMERVTCSVENSVTKGSGAADADDELLEKLKALVGDDVIEMKATPLSPPRPSPLTTRTDKKDTSTKYKFHFNKADEKSGPEGGAGESAHAQRGAVVKEAEPVGSSVKKSPNLTDDVKVELLQDEPIKKASGLNQTNSKTATQTSAQTTAKLSSQASSQSSTATTTQSKSFQSGPAHATIAKVTIKTKPNSQPNTRPNTTATSTEGARFKLSTEPGDKPNTQRTTFHMVATGQGHSSDFVLPSRGQGGQAGELHFDMRSNTKNIIRVQHANTAKTDQKQKSPRDSESSVKAKSASGSQGTEKVTKVNEEEAKAKPLRNCSGCGIFEPEAKAFKKCSKCKAEKVEQSRYYCGRACQVKDWAARHKDEHKQNTQVR